MQFEGIEVRPVPETGLRIVRGPGEFGSLLGTNDDEEKPITYVSQSLYDAIPRVEIDISDIPDPEDTWEWMDQPKNENAHRWVLQDGYVATVYFILNADTGMTKIGFTTNFEKRLATYRGHNAGELEVYKMPGNKMLERFLLRRFRPIRRQGEWHYPHPALIAYINATL